MSYVNNNRPREDNTFLIKVKDPLLSHGDAGMLIALLVYRNQHDHAVAQGKPGLNYNEFSLYLKSQGADLRQSEADYLCRSFDDKLSGFISPSTFTRHLLGINLRRVSAVKQAWSQLPKNEDGEVSLEVLTQCYERTAGASIPFGHGMKSAFHNQKREALRRSLGKDEKFVSYDEFLAYNASVSLRVKLDEDFQIQVLREWSADSHTEPLMAETDRDWGEEGDPLAYDGPLLVRDALSFELGRSSKQYNYSHNQREWRDGIPLPQVDRPAIMVSTITRDYQPYSTEEQNLADPLFTRRGQMY